ncbi:STAS domain-containing protein [Planktothrix sp. FACHB-1355]|uniref:STAS domain-containing protein n=1 Tax=Aerosakkonema funiforme FACHB-1375 TaxID=2949571 RepID=A0A926VPF6_9CYAN|nr:MULTISPECIES: STAS domain-containing protein [Oscillatoriales]MBD2186224.1 STAS domain-containing protein [Aerosakkonema funiforme FACHB-1375]MBD3559280.1 STAS domain-containing protein [Planktothrix sp. FACHB-1355]
MEPLMDFANFPHLVNTTETGRPRTVVLRPNGCLDNMSCPAFTKALEQALELTSDTVVVDLLWVDNVEAEGVNSLISGLKRAASLGKTLSLRFMDVGTQAAVEAACVRQYV